MNKKYLLVAALIPALISCATVTVNVYFPDKDVEAAFENIESQLDFDVDSAPKDTEALKAPAKKKSRSAAPWTSLSTAALPPSGRSAAFFAATPAWAAEGGVNINAQLAKMKDVQASLARRRERIETLHRLHDASIVGLDRDGQLTRVPTKIRPDSPPAESLNDIFGESGAETALTRFLWEENQDRLILVRGMAIATLRATEQDEKDEGALQQATEKSQSIYTRSLHKKLKPGWFYRDEDGDWKRVEADEPEERPDDR